MSRKSGFTLIELSIVLVVIGLIIGSILVGEDLINAAAARAQVSQIERYNSAVNTFRGKYNDFLPGDIPDPYASQFGFITRGTSCSGTACAGEGNGDGILQDYKGGTTGYQNAIYGETAVFWVDLSTAGLIDTTLKTATIDYAGTYTNPAPYMPAAKVGNGNYVYTWSCGVLTFVHQSGNYCDGNNYYALAVVTAAVNGAAGSIEAQSGLMVAQAFYIDTKMDDGLPQTGKVFAFFPDAAYLGAGGVWASGEYATVCATGGGTGCPASSNIHGTGTAVAMPATTAYYYTNCYDTNGVNAANETYSMKNNASAVNCALSFQFQ